MENVFEIMIVHNWINYRRANPPLFNVSTLKPLLGLVGIVHVFFKHVFRDKLFVAYLESFQLNLEKTITYK